MKTLGAVVLTILVLSLAIAGCTMGVADQSEFAIRVWKLGDTKGQIECVPQGTYFDGPRSDVYTFPATEQQVRWEGENQLRLISSDQVQFGANGSFSWLVASCNDAIKVFRRYRRTADQLSETLLQDQARRTALRISLQTTSDSLYGSGSSRYQARVLRALQDTLIGRGITGTDFGISGQAPSDPAMTQVINNRNKVTQQALTREAQLRTVLAQNAIDSARAIAQARNNEVRQASITPQLIRMRELDIEEIKAKAWQGGTPTTVVYGSSSSSLLSFLGPPLGR